MRRLAGIPLGPGRLETQPLADGVVVATIAREGNRTGLPSRTAVMEHRVGDMLPRRLTRDRARSC